MRDFDPRRGHLATEAEVCPHTASRNARFGLNFCLVSTVSRSSANPPSTRLPVEPPISTLTPISPGSRSGAGFGQRGHAVIEAAAQQKRLTLQLHEEGMFVRSLLVARCSLTFVKLCHCPDFYSGRLVCAERWWGVAAREPTLSQPPYAPDTPDLDQSAAGLATTPRRA